MAVIEIKNLVREFTLGGETVYALNGIDFTIQEGEFVSITGPSGCGKSTLMNILGLLDQPTSGQYLLDSKNAASLSDDESAFLRNQKIGFVFQNFYLLSRASALRNVELPLIYSQALGKPLSPRITHEKAADALKRVGLSDRKNHKPNELSGGQRQRVAIARALVNEPKLILADEPTGNLDSKTGEDILNLFKKLNEEGVTIVLVTHDPSIAKRTKRTIAMLDGKIKSDTVNRT